MLRTAQKYWCSIFDRTLIFLSVVPALRSTCIFNYSLLLIHLANIHLPTALSILRYCSASISSAAPICSTPFMSAMVRATRRMRS